MSKDTWAQWLNANVSSKDVALELVGALREIHPELLSNTDKKINVTRIGTSDCYIASPPPYVDVNGLHAIYDRLAFESNVILKGPKGVGKSISFISWAAKTNIPIIVVECSEDTKKYDLMGSQFLLGNETVYVLGAIPAAIDIANEVGFCILAFEEFNGLTPQVQKQLNAVTDFRKAVSLPHIGKTYKLKEGAKLWVVATMNPTVYGGTYDLNEDLKSRFEEIEITYPPMEYEKRILKTVGTPIDDRTLDLLIRLAKETRQDATGYALSTRDLTRLLFTVSRLGLDGALQMILGKFEGEDKDIVMKRITSIFGPRQLTKYWGNP